MTQSQQNMVKTATSDLVGRMPPFNEEAEQAVLACIMHFDDLLDACMKLSPSDFHVPQHAVIYQACLELYRDKNPIEPRSLAEKLAGAKRLEAAGGAEYINEIWSLEVLGASGPFYAGMVASKSKQRRLINACAKIMADTYDTPWDQVPSMLDGSIRILSEIADSGAEGHARWIGTPPGAIPARYRALAATPDAGAVSTGYTDLDAMLSGGLRSGELTILAGQTGGCKTALSTCIAYNAAMAGKNVAYYSLEMSIDQMEDRFISIASCVPIYKLRSPSKLREADWQAVESANTTLSSCAIMIDDTPALSPYDLHARCSRIKRSGGLDLVIVDYLQIMGSPGRVATRELEVAKISKLLKAVAKEMSVPVLALSQLNRSASSREDQRPLLSDLRESGAIEQDADIVMFVHRHDSDDSATVVPLEVIVAKHRNGRQGTVHLLLEKAVAGVYNGSPAAFNSASSSPAPRPAFPPRDICPF